ncbi:hypothetical protein [Nesterenkonia flava]|uniref:NAD-dependent epimerase/dehydratase domain-containing protein n=1 Tax=Nesterenkonia flava TaxID=469799 RepID=A0ABU1FVP2_9MICC|nr:hypothetical protein [Nesterenkonia flava]MDR5712744.1 hypothetical protein [Nesterenkonia flava]
MGQSVLVVGGTGALGACLVEALRSSGFDVVVTPLITMCGLFSGLSGVLAADAAAELDEVDVIRVGLLQGTNAAVGPTGVKDMLRLLTQPVRTGHSAPHAGAA